MFKFDDFNNFTRNGSGAVTIRFIKLEYRLSYPLEIFIFIV